MYFDALDIYGILHAVSRRDMIKVTIQCLENYLQMCREQMEKHGPDAGQVAVIFDMQGFNLRQYLWRPGNDTAIRGDYIILLEHIFTVSLIMLQDSFWLIAISDTCKNWTLSGVILI